MPDFDPLIDPEKLKGLSDTEFKAPDQVGIAEGWRAWKVAMEPPPFGTAPKLYSATWDYYWAPRVKARAHCDICDDVPGETHTCGFYSAKSLEHLRSMGYQEYDPSTGMVCVVGHLACWGKVIEGSQGWRAEYAYPMTLYIPFEAHRLGKPLANAYGVPVKLLNLLDKKAKP
jgi:hypothetical protein